MGAGLPLWMCCVLAAVVAVHAVAPTGCLLYVAFAYMLGRCIPTNCVALSAKGSIVSYM